MPNWCSNRLRVYGPDEDVGRFKEKAVGHPPWHGKEGERSVLNFHSLVPVPLEVVSAGYDPAGYDWEQTRWGCKWGACSATLVDEWEGFLDYSFETPWTPPLPFLSALAPHWPSLKFLLDYEEMSMGFKGIAKFMNGSFEDHCLAL
jgi:hypothetical protein